MPNVVCEDMQVARCLCNFPPTPSKRQAQRNTNESVLHMKTKFGQARIPEVLCATQRPLLLCVGKGPDCSSELTFSPAEWLVLRVGNSSR